MAQNKGKVWLVGAGPGDRGLFTLKGQQVLAMADTVVYDALVGQGVLSMIPPAARLINVGKRANHHLMEQEQINQVLLKEAQAGRQVVRLKGGDPFLFGRGGEELELLAQNDIPFEVVPGVASAIAVPSYNGIPVTHRDYCSNVQIITGHRRNNAQEDIDFAGIAASGGTMIFLMGLASLERICSGLIQAGMAPDTPAAVLSQGTGARQARTVASLGTLKEASDRAQMKPPAIIVVGKVCQLADRFAWYEKLPLFGKKILVTRPRALASRMADKLRRKGAEVLELPAIATVPRPVSGQLRELLTAAAQYAGAPVMQENAASGSGKTAGEEGAGAGRCAGTNARPFDWLVLTSPSGCDIFFDQMSQICDIRALAGVKIAVIGKGTAAALKKHGLTADLMPDVYNGKELGAALARYIGEEPAKVLIARAAEGSEELTQELAKAHAASITDLPVYDTVYEACPVIDEKALFESGDIDYAVFTSASTVKGFAAAAPGLDYSLVNAVCIGRQTQKAAQALGMKTFVSEEATMDSVVCKIEELAGR